MAYDRRKKPISFTGIVLLAVLAVVFAPKITSWFSSHVGGSDTSSDASATTSASTTEVARKSSGSATKAVDSTPAVTSTAPDSFGIRSEHTVKTEVDDMHLNPAQCHVTVVDAGTGQFLPDPSCTPGAIDPAVTQDNIDSTICHSGYTSTVRPPASITGKFKHISLADYGQGYDPTTEYDHLISLELGGATSVSNLWPEQGKTGQKGTTNPKDSVENVLNAAVCSHKVLLHAAQVAIAANWITAEHMLGLGQ